MVFAAKTTAPQLIALLVDFTFKLVSSNGRCSPFSRSRNRKAAGLAKSFYRTIGTPIGRGSSPFANSCKLAVAQYHNH